MELLVNAVMPNTERLFPLLYELQCGRLPRSLQLRLVRRVAAAAFDEKLAAQLPKRLI